MNPRLDLAVPAPSHGERLDRFLAAAQTDLSRSRVQSLVRGGHVRVNGAPARVSQRLRRGDRVTVELPPPATPGTLEPEAIALAIVHEDDDLIVIDKPAGLVVHPGAGVARGTLVHALLHHCPAIAGVGGPGRPGIVHRLDKDTSGLMVVAKTPRAYRALIEAMRRREVTRVYRALVWGSPRQERGMIEGAIGRDPRDRKRMAVLRPRAAAARGAGAAPRGPGKPARTHWRVLRRLGPVTEVEVRLETGRTHQIRVHLAHLGLPVVGDPVYGGRPKKLLSANGPERSLGAVLLDRLSRQALHAAELELAHPVSGERLHFASPVPPDIARALETVQAFVGSRRG
ncbi:MAG TPA: RluA family pseudouridine synthase [Candidatus Eisenbacteria bacterium]